MRVFGFQFRGYKAPSFEEIEAAAQRDIQERQRKDEESASPLAKEVTRLMRDFPEAWKDRYPEMENASGLKVSFYYPSTPYLNVTVSVTKGTKTATLSSSDASLLCGARNEWLSWRNKRHAEDIFAELTT